MEAMEQFVIHHVDCRRGQRLRVLDVGSMNVNGTYRTYFDDPLWEYTGLDLAPGPGVDRVLSSPYSWNGIPSDFYDIVITGQAFEHIEFPWITILQVNRVLVEGGLLCLIVPSGGVEHRYPMDCWRFYPDGIKALARWGDLEPVTATTAWLGGKTYPDASELWADTVLVARKPKIANTPRRWLVNMKRAGLIRMLSGQGARRHGLKHLDSAG